LQLNFNQDGIAYIGAEKDLGDPQPDIAQREGVVRW